MLNSLEPTLARIVKKNYMQDYMLNTKKIILTHKQAMIKSIIKGGTTETIFSLWVFANNTEYSQLKKKKHNHKMEIPK